MPRLLAYVALYPRVVLFLTVALVVLPISLLLGGRRDAAHEAGLVRDALVPALLEALPDPATVTSTTRSP